MTRAVRTRSKRKHAVDDCCAAQARSKIETPAVDFSWSDEDTSFTKLFQAWDRLPVHDVATATDLLKELDEIIPMFDTYIGHTDEGLIAWTKKHQRAMELGIVETPTWPRLYTQVGQKKKWKDEVWINRYSFLVHQREVIAKSRLQRMACLEVDDKKQFFGAHWAYPRETIRAVQSKTPCRLRNRWHEPLDLCLARMAYESYGRLDFYTLQREFWDGVVPLVEVKCETREPKYKSMDGMKGLEMHQGPMPC